MFGYSVIWKFVFFCYGVKSKLMIKWVCCIYWLIVSVGSECGIVVSGWRYVVNGEDGVCRNVIGLFGDWIIIL